MMFTFNNKSILLTFVIIAFWGFVWGCNKLHVLRLVRINTESNEPTLHDGNFYMSSSISHPRFLDFCIFESLTQRNRTFWIFRVCGTPGDTIQIKEGILYVNNVNIDKSLTLSHAYKLKKMDTINLKLEEFETWPIRKSDTLVVNLPDASVLEMQLPAIRYVLSKDSIDQQIKHTFHENWNRDHFGPIVVPDSSFFLLGDNRNDALDSRIIGPVKYQNVQGCLLFMR